MVRVFMTFPCGPSGAPSGTLALPGVPARRIG
jgi:hypothetical protein